LLKKNLECIMTQNLVGGDVLYQCQVKMFWTCHCDLRPSEKEHLECWSSASHHKNTPVYVCGKVTACSQHEFRSA
jgi:hypothetical protein